MNIKQEVNGEPCAVLESSPAVKDAVFSLQLFQFTISNVYFTQNESKPIHDRTVYAEASINTSGLPSKRHRIFTLLLPSSL